MEDLENVLENSKNINPEWYTGEETRSHIETTDWTSILFGFDDSKMFNGSQVDNKETLDWLTDTYQYSKDAGVLYTPTATYHPGWFVAPTVRDIIGRVRDLLKDGYIKKGEPMGRILTGKDASENVFESDSFSRHVAASQFNALEMMTQWSTPYDGINDYIYDKTQGPAVALAGGPGTFVRNYTVTRDLGQQFNALDNLSLSHLNGYLIWGNKPDDILRIINEDSALEIRIPAMLYTQSAGVQRTTSEVIIARKLSHQIYLSSVPKNNYSNSGDDKAQDDIIERILTAEYIGAIGLNIILSLYDGVNFGLKEEPLNVTLVGTGAFKNPVDLSIRAFMKAVKKFEGIGYMITLHDYTGNMIDQLVNATGLSSDGNYNKFHLSSQSSSFIDPEKNSPSSSRKQTTISSVKDSSEDRQTLITNALGVSNILLDEKTFSIFSRLYYNEDRNKEDMVEYDNYIKLLIRRYESYTLDGNTLVDEFERSRLPSSGDYQGFEGIGIIKEYDLDNTYLLTKDGKAWKPRDHQLKFIKEFYGTPVSHYSYTDIGVKVVLVKIFIDGYPYIYYINDLGDITYILSASIYYDEKDPSSKLASVSSINDDWSYILYGPRGEIMYEDLPHAEIDPEDIEWINGRKSKLSSHGKSSVGPA
jgi:hypothetical protein